MTPFDLLQQRFSPAYAKQLASLPNIELYDNCHCCGRPAANFNHHAYTYKDSANKTHAVCEVCAIINQQNAELLGYANGKIGYQLSSFKGGYLVIPLDEKKPAELWMGGKYLERLLNSEQVTIVGVSGNNAKLALLKNREPKLVIETTPRRELWLRNLAFSTDKTLRVATETGVINVNYDDFERLNNAFLATNLKPSNKKALITQLRLSKNGLVQPDNKNFVKVMSACSDDMLETIRQVSQEPIGFLFMLDALSAN